MRTDEDKLLLEDAVSTARANTTITSSVRSLLTHRVTIITRRTIVLLVYRDIRINNGRKVIKNFIGKCHRSQTLFPNMSVRKWKRKT